MKKIKTLTALVLVLFTACSNHFEHSDSLLISHHTNSNYLSCSSSSFFELEYEDSVYFSDYYNQWLNAWNWEYDCPDNNWAFKFVDDKTLRIFSKYKICDGFITDNYFPCDWSFWVNPQNPHEAFFYAPCLYDYCGEHGNNLEFKLIFN